MNNIVVDPVVVITPVEDAKKEDVEVWLNNLNIWLKEVFNSPHHWFHLAEIIIKHLGYGRLPNFTILRAWQKKYGNNGLEIDIPQILNDVSNFFLNDEFELGRRLEDHLLESGYIVTPKKDSIVIRPHQFLYRCPELIQDEMSLVFAIACAGKHKQDTFASNLYIATLALPELEREIEVSGEIAFLSDNEGNVEQVIFETLPLLFTPEDIAPLDIISLWKQGEKGIYKAIEQQYKKDWQSSVAQPLKFHLGSRFIESVNNAGLDTNEVVLSKIVRVAAAIIADKAKDLNYDLRHLRESETAGSPQRTRLSDNAKAWRLTMIERGAGWRMHYWQIPALEGSIIEFANVLKKHDPEEIY